MVNYTNYDFYINKYKGDMPDGDFDRLVIRASAEVQKNIFNRDIEGYEEQVQLATCSVADVLYKIEQIEKKQTENTQITSKKVGDVSINYSSVDLDLIKTNQNKEILKVIKLYLLDTGLMYRGV